MIEDSTVFTGKYYANWPRSIKSLCQFWRQAFTQSISDLWQLTDGQLAVGVLRQVFDEGPRHVPATQNEGTLVAHSCRCGVLCGCALTQGLHLGPKANRPCSHCCTVLERKLSIETDMVGNKGPTAITVASNSDTA